MRWWRGPLYTRPTGLDTFYIVLAHWNNPRIDMSPFSDTSCWFRANQSLFFPLNDACLAKKQKYQFCSLWFEPIGNRTHDLQHSMRARLPLHHRSSLKSNRPETKQHIEKKSNRRDKIFSLDNTEYMLEKRNDHDGYKKTPKEQEAHLNLYRSPVFLYSLCSIKSI